MYIFIAKTTKTYSPFIFKHILLVWFCKCTNTTNYVHTVIIAEEQPWAILIGKFCVYRFVVGSIAPIWCRQNQTVFIHKFLFLNFFSSWIRWIFGFVILFVFELEKMCPHYIVIHWINCFGKELVHNRCVSDWEWPKNQNEF